MKIDKFQVSTPSRVNNQGQSLKKGPSVVVTAEHTDKGYPSLETTLVNVLREKFGAQIRLPNEKLIKTQLKNIELVQSGAGIGDFKPLNLNTDYFLLYQASTYSNKTSLTLKLVNSELQIENQLTIEVKNLQNPRIEIEISLEKLFNSREIKNQDIKPDDFFVRNPNQIKNEIKLGSQEGELWIGGRNIQFKNDNDANEVKDYLITVFSEIPMSEIYRNLKSGFNLSADEVLYMGRGLQRGFLLGGGTGNGDLLFGWGKIIPQGSEKETANKLVDILKRFVAETTGAKEQMRSKVR